MRGGSRPHTCRPQVCRPQVRPIVERYDLSPCFNVIDPGNHAASLIVHCRFCSAGWLPQKNGPALGGDRAAELLEHARRHDVEIKRRPVVAKTIERLFVIRIDGRIVKRVRDRISADRAQREQHGRGAVEVECSYRDAPLPPAPAPPLRVQEQSKAQRWSAAVEAWRRSV